MLEHHRRQPRMGRLIDVIEHDAPRTFDREGQALSKIRLPDGPQQPVILGFRLAGHAGLLGAECRNSKP